MNFIKAYKERFEEKPNYISDYEFYLLDEFVHQFIYNVIKEYFEEGKTRKTIEIPISEVFDFVERKGKYLEKDKNGNAKEPRKVEEIKQALLDDIRNVDILGFKVENGHIIINSEDLIKGYYDYLYACHDIPENLDDYAFYLFDEFVKEFVSILIKSYDQNMEDNQIISFPLIQVWRIFKLKGYKNVESAKPIILKDMINFGFKIEGSYNGYIVIDLATLKKAYERYMYIDKSKLTDLGYELKSKNVLIQNYFKELSEKAIAREKLTKRTTTLARDKELAIPQATKASPTLKEPSAMSQDDYLNFLKTYFDSDEEPMELPSAEVSTTNIETNDINEIFQNEIVFKALNEMINACTTHNLDKITIDYSVFDNYVIYNGLRINGVNASDFTNLIASIPGKMIARRGNTITIEYSLEDLYNFYYEEFNKVTR